MSSNDALPGQSTTPDEVLKKIGVQGLVRIADRARVDCIGKKVTEAFRTWYGREMKAGRIRGHADFAEVLGCDKSTANRYFNGRIRKTDVLRLDDYLRRTGTTLKEVLPEELEIRHAILSATIAATMKARRIPVSRLRSFFPIDSETWTEIAAIVRDCPLPEAAERDPKAWERWILSAVTYSNKHISARRGWWDVTYSWLKALCAGDWQVVRMYLPWQVASVLVVVSLLEAIFGARAARLGGEEKAGESDIDGKQLPSRDGSQVTSWKPKRTHGDYCSFCRKPFGETTFLMGSEVSVDICRDCADLCRSIVQAERAHQEKVIPGKEQYARCSFCQKPSRESGLLVEGPGDIWICEACVEKALAEGQSP